MFKRYPQNIADITQQFLRENSLETPLLSRRLIASWTDIVPIAADYTDKVENGWLHLADDTFILYQSGRFAEKI